jgi:acyl-CoA thioester hydrolase
MKRPLFPSPQQVRQLPVQLSMVIPPEWEDRNGHVNVQYYLKLYELGGYEVLNDDDFGIELLQNHNFGLFDFEHHLFFRAEMHVGDKVSTYNRLLALNHKRMQGMYFIVNDTRDQLACCIEYLSAGVDLASRRTAVFPEDIHCGLERQLKRHQALDWPAPVSGAIRV